MKLALNNWATSYCQHAGSGLFLLGENFLEDLMILSIPAPFFPPKPNIKVRTWISDNSSRCNRWCTGQTQKMSKTTNCFPHIPWKRTSPPPPPSSHPIPTLQGFEHLCLIFNSGPHPLPSNLLSFWTFVFNFSLWTTSIQIIKMYSSQNGVV